MVKVAPSILVAALTLASSSALAAPTPTASMAPSPETDPVAIQEDVCEESNKNEQEKRSQQRFDHNGGLPTITERNVEHLEQLTSSQKIRRGIPLVAKNPHGQLGAEGLHERDLVGTLGVTGALAPLGVGGVVTSVETTIDGLPVVGGVVGGIIHTVDDTVGLGSLLNPKPPVSGGPKEKRQTPSANIITSLAGGLPLASLTGALPITGLGGLPLSSLAGELPLSSLEGTTGNLPVSSLTGGLPSEPLAILEQIAQLQSQLAKLVPTGAAYNLPSYLSRVSAAYVETPNNGQLEVDQGGLPQPNTALNSEEGGSFAMPSHVLAAAPPTQSTIYLDDDSGSEYSDEENDEGEEQTLISEQAAWTVTSSLTMANTASQAAATAEAMSLTTSEAGSTAVPTSAPDRRRSDRTLD
ncbi:hypothetical protein T439DRAFT_348408 [Meredithblackwellia eburnea MCA 4105]